MINILNFLAENLFSIILQIVIIIITVLSTVTIKHYKKILNNDHNTIIKLIKERNALEQQLVNVKQQVNDDVKQILTLRKLLLSFINTPIKVYTNSNFYNNYNFYNNKFYAKINNKTSNNKAEAIPIMPVDGSRYKVLDIYKLKHLLSSKGSNTITFDIEDCYVNKEDLVNQLGTKVLKGYKGL